MELCIVQMVYAFLFIVARPNSFKVLTLRVKVFLALTELLLCSLIICRHSFLCLIISFLLSDSLFNHCDPTILVLILLLSPFEPLINNQACTSSVNVYRRIRDLLLIILLLLARSSHVLDYFKLFYLSVLGKLVTGYKLSSSGRFKDVNLRA